MENIKMLASEPLPSTQLFRLDNRTIIITGGAGALGVSLTKVLLEYGADVAVTDKLPDPPKQEWDHLLEVAKQHNRLLLYSSMDVRDATAVDHTFASLLEFISHPIRGLVTCAGVSERYPAEDYPADSFRRILDINVTGTMLCAQAAFKFFQAQGVPGSIVLIASMSGTIVNQGVATSAYNASKSAVLQMGRSLAAEWGGNSLGQDALGLSPEAAARTTRRLRHPVRVNTLSPGYIRTEATGPTLAAIPGIEEVWERGNMLGRLALAHEFRAPVLFLLGDGSSFVTGSDLKVDGGATAW